MRNCAEEIFGINNISHFCTHLSAVCLFISVVHLECSVTSQLETTGSERPQDTGPIGIIHPCSYLSDL